MPLAADILTLVTEFVSATGRPLRCGWFDGFVVRYAARVNGLTDLAVTKLDVLDTLDRIGLCTGYEAGGEVYEEEGEKHGGSLARISHSRPAADAESGLPASSGS